MVRLLGSHNITYALEITPQPLREERQLTFVDFVTMRPFHICKQQRACGVKEGAIDKRQVSQDRLAIPLGDVLDDFIYNVAIEVCHSNQEGIALS